MYAYWAVCTYIEQFVRKHPCYTSYIINNRYEKKERNQWRRKRDNEKKKDGRKKKKTESMKKKEKLMVTIEVWKWKLKQRIGFKFQIKCNVGDIESLEVKD